MLTLILNLSRSWRLITIGITRGLYRSVIYYGLNLDRAVHRPIHDNKSKGFSVLDNDSIIFLQGGKRVHYSIPPYKKIL